MPNGINDRLLIDATAAKAAHMTEFLTLLGLDRDTATRKRWRDALSRWQVDTTHWIRSPTRLYTDEDIARAVEDSVSVAGVLRTLGIPPAGGSHTYMSRRIRAAGIDTSHFLGQAYKRGQASPGRLSPQQVLRVFPPGSARIPAPRLRRALMEMGIEERCKECGIPPVWRGRPLRLVVDHESGDWLDNRIDNLRFLCPNCHAQTATWCRQKAPRRPA